MALTRALVLRSLGAVTLIAFASLWVQIDGLVGSNGILPFAPQLEHVAANSPGNPFWSMPTLFWWWPTDIALHGACGLGVVGSLLLLTGLPVEGPVLLGLWALYLSLSQVGQIFLGYQWDTLLTETLFVAAWAGRWHPWAPREPSVVAIWALRLLLFKLMLGSGLVKLTSGDATWKDGTALAYHYFTQPIPNPLSWSLHHLPASWHALETWTTLVIEILLPFALFVGRPGRLLAFAGFTVVLAMLFFTGNYGFFQLLSMVLVLALLDDDVLRGIADRMPQRLRELRRPVPTLARPAERLERPDLRIARDVGVGALLAVWVAISLPMQYGRTFSYQALGERTIEVLQTVAPWRTVNAYGLFASMTTQRPEVVIEGSDDGTTWTPYVFRYKAGPVDRAPPVVAPHMPRLDWQMWFAALRSCDRAPWVQNLMFRLSQNQPEVVALIEHDPFPGGGPRWIRARRELYTFTDEGPDWWSVQGDELYCRPVETMR